MRRLDLYRDRLAVDLGDYRTPCDEALRQRDAFLLTSMFQKGLRRAERRFVFGAGKALLRVDPARLWRRLVVGAVEDFGLSDLALTETIIAAAASKRFRGKIGGDERVLSFLLDRLLRIPCDRRLDHAYMLASAIERRLIAHPAAHEEDAPDAIVGFLERACELVRFCERKGPDRFYGGVQASRCDETLFRLAEEGLLEEELLELCLQARRLSHCVLPVLLPLVKAATEALGGERVVHSHELAPTQTLGGIPAYALDGHTRLGRAVLESLLRENRQMGRLLGDVPSPQAKLAALASLLFLIEGGLCARECSDPFSQILQERARGCLTGLAHDRLPAAIALMEELLPTIAFLRARHGARLERPM